MLIIGIVLLALAIVLGVLTLKTRLGSNAKIPENLYGYYHKGYDTLSLIGGIAEVLVGLIGAVLIVMSFV